MDNSDAGAQEIAYYDGMYDLMGGRWRMRRKK
jgi:hypothetical protein